MAEVLTSSVVFVMLFPALLLSAAGQMWLSFAGPTGEVGAVAESVAGVLPPHVALLGVVLPDYLFSVFVAVTQRRIAPGGAANTAVNVSVKATVRPAEWAIRAASSIAARGCSGPHR